MSYLRAALCRFLAGESLWTMEARAEIPEREFGALAGWWCEGHYYHRTDRVVLCGPVWKEPEQVCTYRGCGWESYTGPEPDEWEPVCPECGGHDVYEWTDHKPGFRVVARHRSAPLGTARHRSAPLGIDWHRPATPGEVQGSLTILMEAQKQLVKLQKKLLPFCQAEFRFYPWRKS